MDQYSKNVPRGVPSLTYVRVLNGINENTKNDVQSVGNSITVTDSGQVSLDNL